MLFVRLPCLSSFRLDDAAATVEYLGVICMVLVTRRPLVPYYVVNIADQRVPFTGIIGMTNLVAQKRPPVCISLSLPKYVDSTTLLRLPDTELRDMFFSGP